MSHQRLGARAVATQSMTLLAQFVSPLEGTMRDSIRRLVGGACLFTLLVAVPSVALAQASAPGELRFPARGIYRNPTRVVQQYDAIFDRTRLVVGIASGAPLSILIK